MNYYTKYELYTQNLLKMQYEPNQDDTVCRLMFMNLNISIDEVDNSLFVR